MTWQNAIKRGSDLYQIIDVNTTVRIQAARGISPTKRLAKTIKTSIDWIIVKSESRFKRLTD